MRTSTHSPALGACRRERTNRSFSKSLRRRRGGVPGWICPDRAGGIAWVRQGFKPAIHPDHLSLPARWKKPRLIFVNSMSDLFHEAIPDAFIENVFAVIAATPRHRYQVLIKRSDRLARMTPPLTWPRNLWMGVTVEIARYAFRIDHLRSTNAEVKFISFEPLLGGLRELNLTGMDWVIAGGEPGPRARPIRSMHRWRATRRPARRAPSRLFPASPASPASPSGPGKA